MLVLDPREWTELDVGCWVIWAVKEFCLENVSPKQFVLNGREMINQGKECFLNRTSAFMGDILWEHLDLLMKGKKLTDSPQKHPTFFTEPQRS